MVNSIMLMKLKEATSIALSIITMVMILALLTWSMDNFATLCFENPRNFNTLIIDAQIYLPRINSDITLPRLPSVGSALLDFGGP